MGRAGGVGRRGGPLSRGSRSRTAETLGEGHRPAVGDSRDLEGAGGGTVRVEQGIKEGKAATRWTRLSRHRFRANEVRLLLCAVAYNLGNLLRRLVLPLAIQSWSLTSIQQRLFKIAGRLSRHARYFTLPVRAPP